MYLIFTCVGSSSLSTKGKRRFYICVLVQRKIAVWVAKKPDIIGLFARDIFFVSTLWRSRGDSNTRPTRLGGGRSSQLSYGNVRSGYSVSDRGRFRGFKSFRTKFRLGKAFSASPDLSSFRRDFQKISGGGAISLLCPSCVGQSWLLQAVPTQHILYHNRRSVSILFPAETERIVFPVHRYDAICVRTALFYFRIRDTAKSPDRKAYSQVRRQHRISDWNVSVPAPYENRA